MFMSRNKITIVSIYYPPERGAAASRVFQNGLLDSLLVNIDVNVITALPNHPTGRIFAGYHHRIAHHETIDDVSGKAFIGSILQILLWP